MISTMRKSALNLRRLALAENARIARDQATLERMLEAVDPVELFELANHLEELAAVVAEKMAGPVGPTAVRAPERVASDDAPALSDVGVRLSDVAASGDRIRCVVCMDEGCEFCPAVDSRSYIYRAIE